MTDTEGKERTVQGEGWDRGRGWDWERMSNVSLKLKTGTTGCQNFTEMETGAPLGRGRRRRFFFLAAWPKKSDAQIFFQLPDFVFLMGDSRFGGEREKVVGGYMAIRSRPEEQSGGFSQIFQIFQKNIF